VHEFKSMTRQVTNRPGFSSFPSEMSDGSPHGWLPWAQHRPNSGENPLETELRPERIAWKPTAPTCVPQYQNGEIERESSPVSNLPGHWEKSIPHHAHQSGEESIIPGQSLERENGPERNPAVNRRGGVSVRLREFLGVPLGGPDGSASEEVCGTGTCKVFRVVEGAQFAGRASCDRHRWLVRVSEESRRHARRPPVYCLVPAVVIRSGTRAPICPGRPHMV
jgi:hypothetical protein